MSSAWRGSKAGWAAIRAHVLAENQRTNGGRCRLAIKDVCTVVATQAHHTLGRAVTGDDLRYLQAVCAPCNWKVGDPQRAPDPPARPVTKW